MADAHRLQAVAPADASQFVDEFRHQHRAGGAERMSEGDGAAVGVHFGHVGVEFALPGENHRSEGLVNFDHVHIVEGQRGALQDFLRGGDDAVKHEGGIGADRDSGDDARQRGQVVPSDGGGGSDEQRGGRVTDLAGIARGHDAVFLEDGFEGAHFVAIGGTADALVNGEQASVREGSGDDLVGEESRVEGASRFDVRVVGVVVQFVTGEIPLFGHEFGAESLMDEGVADVGPGGGVVCAEGLVRHHLGATREDEVGVAREDGLCRKVDGLLAGAAHAVEADGWDVDGEARFEDAEPRQVAALIAEGCDDAPDGVVEAGRLDASTLDGRAHDEGSQFDGLEGMERAALFARANGGADGGDDEDVGIGHGGLLVDFWGKDSIICI